jgi:hypothetical protein
MLYNDDIIQFTTNWNNKLNCLSFTTFRLRSSKFAHSKVYKIYLGENFLGTAKCVAHESMMFNNLTNRIAYLDTGYNLDKMKTILRTMYKNKLTDIENTEFVLLTMVWDGCVPPNLDNAPKRTKKEVDTLAQKLVNHYSSP